MKNINLTEQEIKDIKYIIDCYMKNVRCWTIEDREKAHDLYMKFALL